MPLMDEVGYISDESSFYGMMSTQCLPNGTDPGR